MTKCLLLIAALTNIAFAGCLPVTGDRIRGRDLALADSRFSALPATLIVGFAPGPGAKRIYTAAELERLGRANGIQVQNASEICFELPLRQVLEADAVAAMRRSLPPGAELNIVELSKTGVPAGQLEFPPEGLEPATPGIPGTQLWRGYVRYAETLKADYWARVRITAHFTAVVAAEDLPPNKPIGVALLRIETRSGAIERQKIAARVEDVAGRTLKRPIRAGEPIPLALLTEAAEVRRGDLVTVNVQCGPTHLQFEAIAENAANQGDEIELRNPSSGKTFRAKLGPGSSAEVNVPEGQTL